MMNTVIYALFTTAIMLVVCLLASFAFARLDFKGKNLIFTLFLAMMMILPEILIPQYLEKRQATVLHVLVLVYHFAVMTVKVAVPKAVLIHALAIVSKLVP